MDVQLEPTNRELLSIIALLIEENISLKSQLGKHSIHDSRRVFAADDVRRGLCLCPAVTVTNSRSVVVNLES